ncbi:MAG: TetR/AcrR family transcriptional regulator [Hydrogeniiclostridium sp.]
MKQEEKTERTKNRTIEAAIKEFGKKGYASATIGTICSKYGIAKGLLYHNFTGKKELYLACVSRCFDEVTEYLKAQETDMDLQQYMKKRIRYFSEHPLYARIFFEAILQPPAGLETEIKKRRKNFDQFNQHIYCKAIARLPLRDGITETIALEYYAMIQEMFNGYFSSPAYAGKNFIAKIADHEEKLAQMLDILLYGLAKKE